jgi:hypothetical protein
VWPVDSRDDQRRCRLSPTVASAGPASGERFSLSGWFQLEAIEDEAESVDGSQLAEAAATRHARSGRSPGAGHCSMSPFPIVAAPRSWPGGRTQYSVSREFVEEGQDHGQVGGEIAGRYYVADRRRGHQGLRVRGHGGWLGYHGGYRWYVLGGGDRAAGDCVVVLDRRVEMRCEADCVVCSLL